MEEIGILRALLQQRENDCALAGEYGAELLTKLHFLNEAYAAAVREADSHVKRISNLECENSRLRGQVEELTQLLDTEVAARKLVQRQLETEIDQGELLRMQVAEHQTLERDIKMLHCTATAAQIELNASISLLKITQEQLDSSNQEKSSNMQYWHSERLSLQGELSNAQTTISRINEELDALRTENARVVNLLNAREKSLAMTKEQLACVTAQLQETEIQLEEQAASYERSLAEANTSLTEAYAKLALSPTKPSTNQSEADDEESGECSENMCTPIKAADESCISARHMILFDDEYSIANTITLDSNETSITCKLTLTATAAAPSLLSNTAAILTAAPGSAKTTAGVFSQILKIITPRHTDIAINTICLALFVHLMMSRH